MTALPKHESGMVLDPSQGTDRPTGPEQAPTDDVVAPEPLSALALGIDQAESEAICSFCKEHKPLAQFSPGNRACRTCRKARYPARKYRASQRRYRCLNREALRAKAAAEYQNKKRAAGPILSVGGKCCTKCKSFKAINQFAIHRGHTDGRQSWCRSCDAHKTRIYEERNPQQKRNWNITAKHRRRALDLLGGEPLTEREWLELVRIFRSRCCYCGKASKLDREHLIPLSRGGCLSVENVLPSCRLCNVTKATRTPLEWFLSRSQTVHG